jgi:transposase-like protein
MDHMDSDREGEEITLCETDRKKLRSFTTSFKLQVIREAKATSRRAAAKRFGANPKRVREWIVSEDKILVAPRDRRKADGGGRKPAHKAIDKVILQRIRKRRRDRQRVTRHVVMAEAKRIHSVRSDRDPTFMASDGWLRKFMARNKIFLRRRTTIAQRIAIELADKVSSYTKCIRHLRKTNNYRAKDIAAMDETGLQLHMPGRTILERGTKTVSIKTTGHEKDRFTVVLAARVDSSKLLPMVIFKGKRKAKSPENITGVIKLRCKRMG